MTTEEAEMAGNMRVECWECHKKEVLVRNDGKLSRHAPRRGERNCPAGAEGPPVWPAHGRPMIRSWDALVADRALPAETASHPAPSVPQRPARAEEMPRAVHGLLKAVRPPWTATATFSRGTWPGTTTGEVECIVVRLRSPGSRAWAAWLLKTGGKKPSWSFETAQVVDRAGCRTLGASDVTAMVKCNPGGAT